MKKNLLKSAIIMAMVSFSLNAMAQGPQGMHESQQPQQRHQYEDRKMVHLDKQMRDMDERVSPRVDSHNKYTYEWCKAKGSDFTVGLRHEVVRGIGDGERKYIVIRHNGSKEIYPLMFVGEGSVLPETTIHVKGDHLWIELWNHEEDIRDYYYYNVKTGEYAPSSRQEYRNYTHRAPRAEAPHNNAPRKSNGARRSNGGKHRR